jgi:hypothetical protein
MKESADYQKVKSILKSKSNMWIFNNKINIKLKIFDPIIEYNLKNNFINFKEIQEVLYDDIDYYQFIRTDHPEYPKIKEFYEFLIK